MKETSSAISPALTYDFRTLAISPVATKSKIWKIGVGGVLGSFENSYIPENPRTPPISYISQTVIPFKKPTSGLSKTFFLTKPFKYAKKKKLPICKVFEKKILFFRKFFFATGLKFERFLAPRSRFFEKVNGLGVLGELPNYKLFRKTDFEGLKIAQIQARSQNFFSEKTIFFFKNFSYVKKKCTYAYFQFCLFAYISTHNRCLKSFVKKNLKKSQKKSCTYTKKKTIKVAHMQNFKKISFFGKLFSANYNHYERFGGSQNRFLKRITISKSDDVDQLAEKDEENRHRCPVNACSEGPKKHKKVIIGIGKCKQF
ncbi:hypothetical protein LXL04_026131 [Taraxacum kok-saghyz]